MEGAPKKARSRKEQMQLDRARWLLALHSAAADPRTALTDVTFFIVWRLVTQFHNDEEGAFPSHQTLAAATGFGLKAVRVHLDLAVAAGFLIKRRVGNMRPNVYFMDLAVLQRPSDQSLRPGQSAAMNGPPSPVTSPSIGPKEGVLRGRPDENAGVVSGQSVQVIGPTAPSDRSHQSKVIGPPGPTNHIEENHEEEPRQQATRGARPGARTRPSSQDSDSSLWVEKGLGSQPAASGSESARAPDDDDDAAAFA